MKELNNWSSKIKYAQKCYCMKSWLIQFLKAYKTLYFEDIFYLLSDNCIIKNTSTLNNFSIIEGKENIIQYYTDLRKKNKQLNSSYHGSIFIDFSDNDFKSFEDPILGIYFIKYCTQKSFCLSIKIDETYMINEISLCNENKYPEVILKEAKDKLIFKN